MRKVAFDTGTGLITYVGPGRGVAGGVDVTGRVLMPGLANAHTHSGMTPLRGYAEDMDLQDWLARVRAFEIELTADDFFWGLQLAMVEMLRTGKTTFADMFVWDSRLLDGTAALASEFAGDPQVRIALGPHAPYTCSPEVLRDVAARARSLELPESSTSQNPRSRSRTPSAASGSHRSLTLPLWGCWIHRSWSHTVSTRRTRTSRSWRDTT